MDSEPWIEKYKPKKSSELICNTMQVKRIINWLNDFNNPTTPSSIIITGPHGVGKSISIKLILKEKNYLTKELHSNDTENKKVISEMMNSAVRSSNVYDLLLHRRNSKYAILINDTDTITSTKEKGYLTALFKQNEKERLFPIIFISSPQHNKLISDIKKANGLEIKFEHPSEKNMTDFIKKIASIEKIKIIDPLVIKKIIAFSQYDIRRLIYILHNLYYNFGSKEVKVKDIIEFCNCSQGKNIDIGLFDATKQLLNRYNGVNNSIILYETEKVLIPLMVHENYYKPMAYKCNSNKDKLQIMKDITTLISRGDMIETNIYTDQNWYLQPIHGFLTCVETSYALNKFSTSKKVPFYNMSFSSDLNKTSLKNINKKNIFTLQSLIPHKNIDDVLFINKIIYQLVKEERFNELNELISKYNLNSKNVEVAIKIDKTLEKITITPKNKKKITG